MSVNFTRGLRGGALAALCALFLPSSAAQTTAPQRIADAPPTRAVLIERLPFVIDAPGDYLVAADLAQRALPPAGAHFGISIRADGVRLDLGGHVLRGAEGTGFGIVAAPPEGVASLSGVEIRDGVLRGWGAGGLGLLATNAARVTNIVAIGNGTPRASHAGLSVGAAARVQGCRAVENAGPGIVAGAFAVVEDSEARSNLGHGFVLGAFGSVRRCTAVQNAQAGLYAEGEGLGVQDGLWVGNGGDGLYAGARALVEGGRALDNGGHGLTLGAGGCAREVLCAGNAGAGVLVAGDGAQVRDCHAAGNLTGIELLGRRNLVVGNTLVGSRLRPLAVPEGNLVGPLVLGHGDRTRVTIGAGAADAEPAVPDNPLANFVP